MSKKLIIMAASAGLVSFAGAFGLGWLTAPVPPAVAEELTQTAVVSTDIDGGIPKPPTDMADPLATASDGPRPSMAEKQLKNLVFEIREKKQEYENKLESLVEREQRLQRTQDSLEKDIENIQ